VMDAFFEGLERAQAAGHDLATLASVASFFVSRVDSEIDKRLDAIGGEAAEALKGKAAVANARLAFKAYTEAFAAPRWRALAAAGAAPQRPLWASTSSKNPAYRDVMYVEQLIVPGTVNTMPQATLEAFADHGEVDGDNVTGNYDDAATVMDSLASVGVDYHDVVNTLEREGVDKFAKSWNELLDTVSTALEQTTQE
jgi:transaldolase